MEKVRLGDVAKQIRGVSNKGDAGVMKKVKIIECVDIINESVKYYDGKRPFLSTGDLNVSEITNLEYLTFEEKPSRANLNVSVDDIIVARMQGTIKVYLVDKDNSEMIVSTGFLVLRNKHSIDKNYLFQIVKSLNFQNEKDKLCTGATQKAINNANFSKLEIPLPSLAEQKAIAAKLDKAQEVIRYTEEIIANYDTLTQSLFLDMFGDIKHNIKYEIGKIIDLVDIVRDGPHVSPKYSKNGIPILSTRNIRPFKLVLDDVKYVNRETFSELTKKFQPKKGDVLLTKGGTTGFAKIVDWEWDFCIWVHLAALRVKENVNSKFIEAALNSYYCYNQSQEKTRGIANKDLGLKRIVDIQLPLPPIALQNQFAERVAIIEAQKQQAQESLAKSQDLFNSLLQESFKN